MKPITILVIVPALVHIASANVLLDEDTVEVGEFPDWSPSSPGAKKQNSDSFIDINGQKVLISCTTARNVPGECRPFSDCYPIFKLRDSSAYAEKKKDGSQMENTVSDELKGIYRGIAGPCSDVVLGTISKAIGSPIRKQNYICCPLSYNYTDVKRPTTVFRPVAPLKPTTYQNTQCGRYFVEKTAENDTENQTMESVSPQYGSEDEVVDQAQGRIVNGRVANRGEFPWAVALMLNRRQFCGGSLVDSRHILTAAHCVYFMNRNDVNRLRVQIGDHNIYATNDGNHEIRGASNVYYHRMFSMKTLYDDVAIIRLSQPVTFTRYIQPICLSTNTWGYENQMASVAGWGQVSERGQQSSVLRTVNVRIWKQNDCIRRYKGRAPAGISRGMLCSGGSGFDSCKGDSGGPLSIRTGSSVTQLGIVSWGIGCGSFPGVYTRVDQYLQWINKNRR